MIAVSFHAQSPLAWIVALGLLIGAEGPDILEVAKPDPRKPFGRSSLIPHRTLTHWPPLWVFAIFFVYSHQVEYPRIAAFGYGFIGGSLLHLLLDAPNPTGIPIKTPLSKSRRSLKLWKSGAWQEDLIGVLFILAGAAFMARAGFFSKFI